MGIATRMLHTPPTSRRPAWRTGPAKAGALLTIVGALLLAATAGCQPEGVAGITGETLPPPAAEAMALHDFAARLGMRVAHQSRVSATLRDASNTVVVYPEPEGAAYVNGTAVPNSGGAEAEGNCFFVPADFVSRLRPLLRQVAEAPKPAARVTPRPRRRTTSVGRVVLDPGHGGKDPGATSVLGFHEKHLVLTVAQLVAEELCTAGVDTRLTRSGDTFIELEDRPAVANRCKADLFVSIHADACANKATSGFTAYVARSADAESIQAANAILRSMAATGAQSKGLRRADYRVLVHSTRPAVLVELGYLTNRWEAARLNTRSHQHRVAKAIARGVLDYLRSE